MKLHNLLEDKSIEHQNVDVPFEYEIETKDEFEYVPMIAHVKVTIVPDKFDTGDSPTGYDAEIISITNKKTGKKEDPNLSKKQTEWILDTAVDKVED